MAEEPYFADRDVQLTPTDLVVLGNIYPLEDIESTQVRPKIGKNWIVLFVITLAAFLVWYFSLEFARQFAPGNLPGFLWLIVGSVALIIWIIGLNRWQKAVIYTLRLNTKAGPVDVLKSNNIGHLAKITKAIKNAQILYSSSVQ